MFKAFHTFAVSVSDEREEDIRVDWEPACRASGRQVLKIGFYQALASRYPTGFGQLIFIVLTGSKSNFHPVSDE
ncbi:hypothetical protein SAMN05192588_1055 [Nonlabens sp. Hel1_33_55]|nr:hypothetical protein SAMN05192588_1055 [Nonlabens sp. Hel1_33_55]